MQLSSNPNTNKLSEILQVVAKYDYRILVGANSEIQLSAMLAEIAKFEKFKNAERGI